MYTYMYSACMYIHRVLHGKLVDELLSRVDAQELVLRDVL